jgi:hypothetical protein
VAATATASAGLAVLLVGTAPRVRALIRGGTWVHFALEWHLAITVLLTGGWAAGWVPGMVLAVSLLGLVQTGVVLHKDASAWHPRRIGSVELASTALVCLLLACSVRMA